MIFHIPTPPSVNEMYIVRSVKGKTGRSLGFGYRKWRDAAIPLVREQWGKAGKPEFPTPLSVTIWVNVNRQSDIDNRIKACIDLLGKALPEMPDDRWIDELTIMRNPHIEGAQIQVFSIDAPTA